MPIPHCLGLGGKDGRVQLQPNVEYLVDGLLHLGARVVEVDEDTAVSAVWQAIDDATEDALVGLCDDPTAFAFAADDFEQREGCGVTMTWDGEGFAGGTNEKDCLSDLNGATYATAEVTLDADVLTSWDRGYDRDDDQVWGAVDGAYEFIRRTTPPTLD